VNLSTSPQLRVHFEPASRLSWSRRSRPEPIGITPIESLFESLGLGPSDPKREEIRQIVEVP
jgi:hypothetical protein